MTIHTWSPRDSIKVSLQLHEKARVCLLSLLLHYGMASTPSRRRRPVQHSWRSQIGRKRRCRHCLTFSSPAPPWDLYFRVRILCSCSSLDQAAVTRLVRGQQFVRCQLIICQISLSDMLELSRWETSLKMGSGHWSIIFFHDIWRVDQQSFITSSSENILPSLKNVMHYPKPASYTLYVYLCLWIVQ